MKRRILVLFLILSPLVFLPAQSLWEGSTAMGRYGEFPTTGMYGACNAFPRNTIVTVQNVANGKTVEVIIVNRLQDAGLFMLLSREAATALGIGEGVIVKTRVVLSEKKRTGLVSSGDDLSENPDPDVNPQAGIAAELAFLEEILGSSLRDEPAREPVPPAQALPLEAAAEFVASGPEIPEKTVEPAPEIRESARPIETAASVPGPVITPETSAAEAIAEAEEAPREEARPAEAVEAISDREPAHEPESRPVLPDIPVVEEAEIVGMAAPESLALAEPLPLPVPREMARTIAEPKEEVPAPDAVPETTEQEVPVVPPASIELPRDDTPFLTERYLPVEPERESQPELLLAEPLIGAGDREPPLIIAESGQPFPEEPLSLLEYAEPEPAADAAEGMKDFIVESAAATGQLEEEEVAAANEPEFSWPAEEPAAEEIAALPEEVFSEPLIALEEKTPVIAEASPKEEIPVASETLFLFEPAEERPPVEEPVTAPPTKTAARPAFASGLPESRGAETPKEERIAAAEPSAVPLWELPRLQIKKEAIYLQIGVYSEPASAMNVASILRNSYPTGILEQNVSGRTLYQVFIGPLSRDEGGVTLLSLKAMGFRDAYIRQGASLE